MVGRVGVEPTMFLTWLIYSQLSSPTGHTDPCGCEEKVGAGRGTRTHDPEITNHVLCQLSYTSV